MNWDNMNLTAPQGWICPICGRVYAPMTPMCFYCGNEKVTISTATNLNEYYGEKLKSIDADAPQTERSE